MSERIRGSYDDALYKSTYTLLTYFTYFTYFTDDQNSSTMALGGKCDEVTMKNPS